MLTLADCEDTVLKAIYKANERYAHWSNGLWLNDAGVEAMVCYEIAEEFASHTKRGAWSIGLEVSYADLEKFSGAARKPGKPPALVRSGARADVVLFDNSEKPKYVIEVKRSWSRQGVLALQLRISPQMSLPCCGLVSASEAGPLQDMCDRDGSLGQFQDKAADFLDGPADETDRRRGGAGVFFGVGRVLAWWRTAAITA